MIRWIQNLIRDEECKRLRFAKCGDNLILEYPCDIRGAGFIHIGNNVHIGARVLMIAQQDAEIFIGDNVRIESDVKLIAFDHSFRNPTLAIKDSGYSIPQKPIRIGAGAYIGHGAVILKNVSIPDNAIVQGGSIVTKS